MKRSIDDDPLLCSSSHEVRLQPPPRPQWDMGYDDDMYCTQRNEIQWPAPYPRRYGRVHSLKPSYGFIRPIPCMRERLVYFSRREASNDLSLDDIVAYYEERTRATTVCVVSVHEAVLATSHEVRFTALIHTVKKQFAFACDSSCNKVFVWTNDLPFMLKRGDRIDFLCIDTDKGLQAIDVNLREHGVIFKTPPDWLNTNNIERLCADWIGVSMLNLTYDDNMEAHITFRTARDAEIAYNAWKSYGAICM